MNLFEKQVRIYYKKNKKYWERGVHICENSNYGKRKCNTCDIYCLENYPKINKLCREITKKFGKEKK